MRIELVAGDARLDQAVEVLGVDLEHLAHLREIERDPAAERRDVALERGARPVGDHRQAMAGADLDDGTHFFGRMREGDRVGRGAGMVGLILAVLLAHRHGRAQAVAEQGADLVQRGAHGRDGEVVHGGTRQVWKGSGLEHSTSSP